MKQALTRLLPLMFLMSIVGIFITGCNNSGNEKETTDTTTKTTVVNQDTVPKEGVAATSFNFPTVRMTRADFTKAFYTNRDDIVMMIYFKYKKIDDVTWDFNTLQAYGANGKGEHLNEAFDLATEPTGPVLNFDLEGKPYHQQITIGNIWAFLGRVNPSTSPVQTGNLPDPLWLVPCTKKDADGKDLIYYRITTPLDATEACPASPQPNQSGRMSSNPSPPAKPCDEVPLGCGELQFQKKYNKAELHEALIQSKTH